MYRLKQKGPERSDGQPVLEPDDETPSRVMRPRVREDTAPRRHAYLPQTVPPVDPVVREIERRRSGRDVD